MLLCVCTEQVCPHTHTHTQSHNVTSRPQRNLTQPAAADFCSRSRLTGSSVNPSRALEILPDLFCRRHSPSPWKLAALILVKKKKNYTKKNIPPKTHDYKMTFSPIVTAAVIAGTDDDCINFELS